MPDDKLFGCSFHSLNRQFRSKYPFVYKILNYDIEKGFLEYEGHYYAASEDLPEKYDMQLYDKHYTIEIYRRQFLTDEKEYEISIDERGFQPPGIRDHIHCERIWFRVLTPIENSEQTTTTQSLHTS